MSENDEKIKAKLYKIVEDMFEKTISDFDEDLRKCGLDSMSSVMLILTIEQEFQIQFPFDRISFENIRTVHKLFVTVSECLNGIS